MSKQKKYHYIYKTTCKITGKFYVGMHSTDNLEDGYLGSGKILGYSRRKYGDENHIKEILEYCQSRDELKQREKEIVCEELLKDPLNINLKYGGEGGWDHLNSDSAVQSIRAKRGNEVQHKKRIDDPEWFARKMKRGSETFKHRVLTGEIKAGWPDTAYENAHSIKAREKRKNTQLLRDFQKGKNNSQFGIKRIGINKDGKIKKILPSQLDNFLKDGWAKGFKPCQK